MRTKASRRDVWMGAAGTLALLLVYMLIWWNRGIQLNSNGLEMLASHAMRAGKMPYLDFAFWCPPMHLWLFSWMAAIFGDGMIYMRAFAVLERMAIFLLVYFWLARLFSVQSALFGTVAAGVGFSSDVGDVIMHYGFDAVLATVASGYAVSVAMTSAGRRARWMYFASGLCAGATMLAKQTEGVGIFAVIVTALLLGNWPKGARMMWRGLAEFLAGWAVPVGLTVWWLAGGGAWQAFVQQNFLEGTASKGSPGQILFRPLLTLTYVRQLLIAFVIAILLMIAYWFWEIRKSPARALSAPVRPWFVWTACAWTICGGCGWAIWLPHLRLPGPASQTLSGISAICIFIGMYGSAAIALRYTWDALQRRLNSDGIQVWILAMVSAMSAYMFSLSWAAFEQMLVPSFAFVFAMVIDRQVRRGWNWRGDAAVALGLILIFTATFRKLTWPYDWANWMDGPIEIETQETPFPEMKGLRVTKAAEAFLSRVVSDIDAHSKPDEKILCYPNYALLYVLAHRDPGTFAYMHWFDIASDKLAREEAARIRKHRPAVMVFVDLPERVIMDNERKFRAGKRSGQRDLAQAIQTMPGYRVVDQVPIPYMDYRVKVYARE